MDATATILMLAVASALVSLVILYLIRHSDRQRAALETAMRARGRDYRYTASSGGRPGRIEITAPDDSWRVRVTLGRGSGGASGPMRETFYERPDLALTSGAALLGPPIPDRAAALAQTMMAGAAGQRLGRMMGVIEEAGADLARLEHVPEVAPADGTLFATPEARRAFDPILGHDAFGSVRQRQEGKVQPILSLTASGFRIRVHRALLDPAEIEALIGFGEGLSEVLRRGGEQGPA